MKKFEHNISIETHALDILLLIPTCNSRLTPPVHVVRDIHRATEYDISSICPCNYIHACIFVNVCVGRELQVAIADHDLSFVGIKEVSFLEGVISLGDTTSDLSNLHHLDERSTQKKNMKRVISSATTNKHIDRLVSAEA